MIETNNVVALCSGAGAGAAVALLLLMHAGRDRVHEAMKTIQGKKGARIGGRAAVRLGLRMAQHGQRTLLVDSPAGVRLMRPEEAAQAGVQYVGALGNLILARQR